jgi:sterol 3beta-glucosyltransferase
MRAPITLVAGGTRGDVQPLAALALRLRARGHAVRLAVNPTFLPWLSSLGLEAVSTEDAPAQQTFAEAARRTTRGPWPLSTLQEILRHKPGIAPMLDRLVELTAGSALLVCSEASSLTLHVADALGVPCVHIRFFPGWPTRSFPAPVIPVRTLGAPLNLASHLAFTALLGVSGGPDVNAWRQRRGLPAWDFTRAWREVERRGWPLLFALSEALVPRPRDWPAHARVTGFWFLDEPEASLPPEVERFLEEPGPVLAVSLGSNIGPRASRVTATVMEALGQLPVRSVFTGTWGAEEATSGVRVPANVRVTGPLPHALLLPRVAAVLHHAGAGTVAQAVRAGIPSIPFPMHGEQRFWALRLAESGLGTRPLHWRSSTARDVVRAVQRALKPDARRSEALARARARVRGEPGLDAAVAEVERALPSQAEERRAP